MLNLASPSKLNARGVMGMNQRNFLYIARYNDRKLYPYVDDKLKTKVIALEQGLAVPELLGVVRYQHEVRGVFDILDKHQGFCIKPAKGSGGKGILVIIKTDDNGYHKASGDIVSRTEVIRHVSNILAGLFSLGGTSDVAVIEALIEFDPVFNGISHHGVPDIRMIVFQGYPIMSMLRLATRASDGKANLHQGAVGVGLGITDGATLAAVQFDRPIHEHPDTGQSLDNIKIAHWQDLLLLSAHCFELSGLGYLGVDIVLDKNRGPLILELNARPGLAIQTANRTGLLPRLRSIEALDLKNEHMSFQRRIAPAEDRVRYAIEHFE